ncbi:G-type lectin S-receptor-like serine/threonine-protein kinase RKS1 [Linum perenne]
MKGFWVSGRYVLIPLFLILKSLICTSVAKDTLEATQFIEDGSILISQGGMFALGFFSPGSSSSNRYLGIWYHKVTVQTVVWVANRNTPINGTSGVLSLDEHGSLVLYSSHDLRAPVWFANASSLSPDAYVAQLLDSGNLVLLQGTRRRIVWQSFDYPTDVALPGMKIGLNLKTGLDRSLTCWKSPNDPGIGDYSFKLDPRGSPQFFLQTRADHYWRSGPWPWGKFPDIYNYTFVNNEDEIYFSFSVNDKSLLLRTVIDDSGTMKRLSWHGIDGQWKEYWSAPKYRCDSYGRCGVYSICDPNNVNMFECTCLPNYEPRNPSMWHLRDGSGGCVRKRLPSSAFCAPGEGFLRVVDIKIPDTSSAVWISRSTSQVACEEACRRNCSCSAYSMKYIQGKQSGCLAWYGELQDTVVFKDSGDDLFVRVDARELGKLLSLKIKLGIAVPSVASVLFAMAIFGYFRLRSWKREKANKIGEGGFGTVYKGQLSNGQEVAVKRLSRSSDQGIQELKNELLLIARLQHRNLVKLLGCCIEDDEQILVYEYVPNKSLDSFIFDETKRPLLNWRTRFNILVGIARGILYLHQDSRFRIIHRDLKSSNILLDEEMNPKISDFGLAKMFDSDQTQNKTTRVVGTYGYMSPEYAVFGKFSVKSDVFSFGIILLEVFSGMKINSFSQELPPRTLIGHVWELWRENRVLELMDPSLKESCVPEEVLRCVHVGLLCVQENATDRPNMSAVVLMLNSETPLPRPNKPAFIFRVVDSMLGTVGGVDGPYSINDLTLTRVLAR